MGDFVEKYEGSKNESGLPHGKGKNISYFEQNLSRQAFYQHHI